MTSTPPPSTPGQSQLRLKALRPAEAWSAAEDLASVYAFAVERSLVAPAPAAGYRFFYKRGDEFGWFDVPIGGAYAIVGTHAECDVVLRGDGRVELRHLLATTIELADGLALRLIDLQTRLPFDLGDGVPRRSLVAGGPLAFRLGEYVCGAIPIDEPAPGEPARVLTSRLATPVITERATCPVSIRPLGVGAALTGTPSAREPLTSGSFDRAASRHSVLPPSVPVGELRAPEPGAEGVVRVTLRGRGRVASVLLGAEALDRGVIVGRAEHCHDGGLRAVLNTQVSRAHVLLLHHYDTFEAFDLCSLNGLYCRYRRVRRVRLTDDGTDLMLGSGGSAVSLHWRG